MFHQVAQPITKVIFFAFATTRNIVVLFYTIKNEVMLLLQIKGATEDFFTIGSLQTFVGTTGMVYAVSNGVQRAFDFNPKWFALLVSQIIMMVAVSNGVENPTWLHYFIGVMNGFLVYLTASGATTVSSSAAGNSASTLVESSRGFTTPWW